MFEKKRKEVRLKKIIGKRVVGDKEYVFEYYTLLLNLYIPKEFVRLYGEEYIVELNIEEGKITIYPKKHQ